MKKRIYIILSKNRTLPGMLMTTRANLTPIGQWEKSSYSHASLSFDNKLDKMYSFGRRKDNNFLDAGLIQESIYKGLFKKYESKNKILVMSLDVSQKEYYNIKNRVKNDWKIKEKLDYNFIGVTKMIFTRKGQKVENKYYCSEWVATVLKEAGVNILPEFEATNVHPCYFYSSLKDNVIYEGTMKDYKAN